MRIERFLVAAILWTLAGCATYNLPVDGVVVDAADGNKPIVGAFVISEWLGHGADIVGSRTSCLKVDVVQADEQGRFNFPESEIGISNQIERIIFAYKKGYETKAVGATGNRIIAMKPFGGTDRERADSFRQYGYLRRCGSADRVIVVLRPLFSALDDELLDLHRRSQIDLPPGSYLRSLEQLKEIIDHKRKFEREQEKTRR